MNLIFILGPPAVGKMTVGRALSQQTGLPLFHNHMSLELVNQFFAWSTPPFRRLDKLIRFGIFEEVAQSDLPGLIFTMVCAFNDPRDEAYLEEIVALFDENESRVHYVELEASLEARLQRNRGEDRIAAKPSKRDVEASEKRLLNNEGNLRMNSQLGDFEGKQLLKIDNTHLTPEEVAARIREFVGL
ncbi:MAG: AAA family ATPase [Bacteroidota bacterium]